jgi:large subunit ribosomal protein L9
MKVVLLENTVAGDKWQVINVADGYARNYLFPNKIALPATQSNLKTTEDLRKQQSKKIDLEKKSYEELGQKLEKLAAMEIIVKAGESGKLFGSVTAADITDKIKEMANIDIDKKRLQVRNIREAGKHTVTINFPYHITAKVEVIVKAEITKEEQIQDMREIMHKKKRSRRKSERVEEAEKEAEKNSEKQNEKSETKAKHKKKNED